MIAENSNEGGKVALLLHYLMVLPEKISFLPETPEELSRQNDECPESSSFC